jgi:glutamate dehydrogenase (NAD(P)+)
MTKSLGLNPGTAGKRVIVQGLGNVGYHAAHFLQTDGDAIITGLAEYEGGLWNPDGLDVQAVAQFRKETGSLAGYPDATFVPDSSELLEHPCDVLVPAALENVITAENAPRIQAKVIAEAANGPIDKDGEKILRQRGVLMIPDLYLNAGGVTVSYFEWLKNKAGVSFDRMISRREELMKRELIGEIERMCGVSIDADRRERLIAGPAEDSIVNAALEQTMAIAYQKIHDIWKTRELPDFRTAAFLAAMDHIAISYGHHGIFP